VTLEPGSPWCLSFHLWVPDQSGDCVVLHRQQGTDTGFYGTELVIRDGKLQLAMIRFWPGQAQAIRTTGSLPREAWIHIVLGNDGSGEVTGLRLIVNGRNDYEIVRDNLYKSPGAGGSGFAAGARFRSTGLAGGRIDDVRVWPRLLTRVEASLLADGLEDADASVFDESSLREHFVETSAGHQAIASELSGATRAVFAAREPVVETMVMEEQPEPEPVWVLARGAYDAPRTDELRVERNVPGCLPPWPADAPRNRLGLARWLVRQDHPLTARVAVNRLWQGFFGRGLVDSSQDFGLQGSYPSHPELLDALARDFVESGWDFKRLCRQIVLSSTYRQTSVCGPELRERDPVNRLLARGPATRLTAEMLRDTALAASGLLDRTMGGPPVSPYQLPTLWTENNTMTNGWRQSAGRDLYRRSLYSVRKRTAPVPNMQVFDAPSREFSCVMRSQTTTPLQALTLLNDVQFVEAMRALAAGVLAAHPADTSAQLEEVYVRLAGRRPTGAERAILAEAHAGQWAIFAADLAAARQLLESGDSDPPAEVDLADAAALTMVAQLVLNSDAVVWKR
jgi:hypothetical protein